MSFYKREDPDPEDWTPHHQHHAVHVCRGCSKILAHGEPVHFFNGWPWCPSPCYRQIVALAMSGQGMPEEQDAFNRVRR